MASKTNIVKTAVASAVFGFKALVLLLLNHCLYLLPLFVGVLRLVLVGICVLVYNQSNMYFFCQTKNMLC